MTQSVSSIKTVCLQSAITQHFDYLSVLYKKTEGFWATKQSYSLRTLAIISEYQFSLIVLVFVLTPPTIFPSLS